MNQFINWVSSDHLLIWSVNVLLQTTLVLTIALLTAVALRRVPTARHGVLYTALLLVLASPAVAAIMQFSGMSVLAVSLAQHDVPAASGVSPVQTASDTQSTAEAPATRLTRHEQPAAESAGMTGQPNVAAVAGNREIEHAQHEEFRFPIESHVRDAVQTDRSKIAETDSALHPPPSWIGKQLRYWMPLFLMVWLAGTVLLLVRLTVGYYRLLKMLRSAAPNSSASLTALLARVGRESNLARLPRLVLSDRASGPASAGLWRPCIILPNPIIERVNHAQLRDILLHELAHIARRDYCVVLLQRLAGALFWLHPLIGLLNRRLAQAREEVCDNHVLAVTDAPTYSRTLLALAELVQTPRPLPCTVGLLTSRWKLERRIADLLDDRRSRSIRLSAPVKSLLFGFALFIGAIAASATITLGTAQAPANDDAISAAERAREAVEQQEAPVPNQSVQVTGVVLKPDGSPAAGATVRAATTLPGDFHRCLLGDDYLTPMTVATADDEGRFTIPIDTNPLGDFARLEPRWNEYWKQTTIAATLDGFGPGWIGYNEIDPAQPITLRLVEDMPIKGKVIDLEGRPVQGVRVTVSEPRAAEGEDLSAWMEGVKSGEPVYTVWRKAPRYVAPRLIGLPRTLRTDEDGSFHLRGVGRERMTSLEFVGPTIAYKRVTVVTRTMPPMERLLNARENVSEHVFGSEFTFTGASARPIEGTLIDADTGEPLPGVVVRSYKLADHPMHEHMVLKTTSNANGRFRLDGMPKGEENIILVVPSDDQPYLMRQVNVPNPAGIQPVSMTVELHRGIWITGRVTDKVSGEPQAGATILYFPFRTNKCAQALPEFDEGNAKYVHGYEGRYLTNVDGLYRIVGLPGKAVVGVQSLLKPYRMGVGYETIETPEKGRSGELLTYSNPAVPYSKWPASMRELDAPEGVEPITLNLELDPGESVELRLVDQVGNPVTGANIVGRTAWSSAIPASNDAVQSVVGLGPRETRALVIHHRERNIGRVMNVGAPEIKKGAIEVTLLPCATVSGRLLREGEPLPGLVIYSRCLDVSRQLALVTTDSDGRFTDTLIPGSRYKLQAVGNGLLYTQIAENLSIQPGETKDLGTLTLGDDGKFVPVSKE